MSSLAIMNLLQKYRIYLMKRQLVSYLLEHQDVNKTLKVYVHEGKFAHTDDGTELDNLDFKHIGTFVFYPDYSPYKKGLVSRMVEIELDVRASLKPGV
jgi:hypothetical protein